MLCPFYSFHRYADMLTPYMNSVPAVIAKASAIHNPIIYAITHPKYRYDNVDESKPFYIGIYSAAFKKNLQYIHEY